MSLLSLLRGQSAPKSLPLPKPLNNDKIERTDAVIELIYAGHDLVRHLHLPGEKGPECVCGAVLNSFPGRTAHRPNCPIQRFYRAVEQARKVIQ